MACATPATARTKRCSQHPAAGWTERVSSHTPASGPGSRRSTNLGGRFKKVASAFPETVPWLLEGDPLHARGSGTTGGLPLEAAGRKIVAWDARGHPAAQVPSWLASQPATLAS